MFKMLIDGGAVSSWIGRKPAELLQDKIKPSGSYIEAALGHIEKDSGKVKLKLHIDGTEVKWNFKISMGLGYDILMGIDLQIKLGITLDNKNLMWYIDENTKHPFYPDLNNETYVVDAVAAIGGLKETDEIQKEEIDKIINELIPKPTPQLQAVQITPHKIDQAYHQIPLEIDSREITAFMVPNKGLYQYKRLPYGLTNAPASFQRAMDEFFGPEWAPQVFIYMDDIIIATKTFNEHTEWLRRVLTKLRDVQLRVNKDKSKFCCSEAKFLGYVVDRHRLRTDPDKTKAVLECKPPNNIKKLKGFLGMVGWYARFLKNLADVR
ncbi:hypothetical protein TKK_0001610 [Trichogramma kaykai]